MQLRDSHHLQHSDYGLSLYIHVSHNASKTKLYVIIQRYSVLISREFELSYFTLQIVAINGERLSIDSLYETTDKPLVMLQ